MATKSPTQFHNHWGSFASQAIFPGKMSPQDGLEVGDQAYSVADAGTFTCTNTSYPSAWAGAGGGGAGSYLELGVNYLYEQAGVPLEETVGQGIFDGSLVGSLNVSFRAIFTPVFTGGSPNAEVRLYDMGPVSGPPSVPRLVSTLSTAAGGLQVAGVGLTVVLGAPGTNDILNTYRMYEVTLYQTSVVTDTVYLGSVGLDVR